MGNTKSTIELNGKKYDARTGRILSETKPATETKAVNHASQGQVLDGFTKRRPTTTHSAVHAQKAGRKPEKSKTLMRPAVTKPVIKNDITSKKQFHQDSDAKSRELRAKHAKKSPMIQRFNPKASSSSVSKKSTHLPVSKNTAAIGRQAKLHATTTPQKSHTQHPFESALKGATAHLETFEGKVHKKGVLHRKGFRNKTANLAFMSIAGLLLFGFFAYQNAPAIEMRVASTRAGVNANMPGYKPSGYGVGEVKSESGLVSVSFRSRTDSKGFTLTQRASNWNSASLLANTVAQNNQPYQTYQDDGKTVYIYNNSNATWVDGGVWYQVEGNANLTSDQLLRIANSL